MTRTMTGSIAVAAAIVFILHLSSEIALAQSNSTLPSPFFLVANAILSDIVIVDVDAKRQYPFIHSSTPLLHPDGLTYHPKTGRLIVSSGTNKTNSQILMYSSRTGALLGRFDDGRGPLNRPYGITFSKDGLYMLVSSFANNLVLRYDANDGRFLDLLPTSPLLNGPNALHYAKDGILYLTTEGSMWERGNLSFPFKSQILRLQNNSWEIFVDDATRFAKPNQVMSPNFLGLASSPIEDSILWATDFSNGILAFDLKSGELIRRIETSYTGTPSVNAIGSLSFQVTGEKDMYTIYVPGFEPLRDNIGCILKFHFNASFEIPKDGRPTFAVAPTTRLQKPISIISFPPTTSKP